MKFSLFVAWRYLFAKKSHNAINIISGITVFAVAMGAMALIVILSVFNGFDKLIQSMINSYDPDIKISAVEGKTFNPDGEIYEKVKKIESIEFVSEVLEEDALLRFADKQYIAVVKGVSDSYTNVSGVDSMITSGEFKLKEGPYQYAVVGQGVSVYLNIPNRTQRKMVIYMPKRSSRISIDPSKAFTRHPVFVSGKFSIEQSADAKYVFVPIDLMRNMLDYNGRQVTALELKVTNDKKVKQVQQELKQVLGDGFSVKNRNEQNEMFYKVMKIEKWAIAFILTFVLFIASFNILGSLTMLILDKKRDMVTLQNLGATKSAIKRIFLTEGWLITSLGGLAGLFLGGLLCWIQIQFEPIKLQGSGSFVINAYPVHVNFLDFLMIIFIVLFIGALASWYPVKKVTKRYLS
ncbi:MAG: FtsX-like permease family protein [Cyclobacteriaceae bacterium]